MQDLSTGRVFQPNGTYIQAPKLSLNATPRDLGYNPNAVKEFISSWLQMIDKLPKEGWPFSKMQAMMDLSVRLTFDKTYFDETFGEADFSGMIHGLGEILTWQPKFEIDQKEALHRLENTPTVNTAFQILDAEVLRPIDDSDVNVIFTVRPTGPKRNLFISCLLEDKLQFVFRDVVTKKDDKVMFRLYSLDAEVLFQKNTALA